MALGEDVKRIVARYEAPRIGVIGGSEISSKNFSLSRQIGIALRKFIGEGGWLFTGGVDGAGLAVYHGIAHYSSDKRIGDRFFTVLPYDTNPWGYDDISKQLFGTRVRNEYCGSSFEARQKAISMVGNVLIMVEGGGGTENEARCVVKNRVPLISFPKSGGAAAEYNKESEYVHPVSNVNEMLKVLAAVTKRKKN